MRFCRRTPYQLALMYTVSLKLGVLSLFNTFCGDRAWSWRHEIQLTNSPTHLKHKKSGGGLKPVFKKMSKVETLPQKIGELENLWDLPTYQAGRWTVDSVEIVRV